MCIFSSLIRILHVFEIQVLSLHTLLSSFLSYDLSRLYICRLSILYILLSFFLSYDLSRLYICRLSILYTLLSFFLSYNLSKLYISRLFLLYILFSFFLSYDFSTFDNYAAYSFCKSFLHCPCCYSLGQRVGTIERNSNRGVEDRDREYRVIPNTMTAQKTLYVHHTAHDGPYTFMFFTPYPSLLQSTISLTPPPFPQTHILPPPTSRCIQCNLSIDFEHLCPVSVCHIVSLFV